MNTTGGKIIVATDLHYGLGRNSRSKLHILKEHVEPRILEELAKGGELKTFVICGDLFHEMVSVRTDIYKEARSFVSKCAELANVIILAGNHDCFDDTTEITSVELFDQMEGVEVVRFPKEREVYGLKCVFLPWADDNVGAAKFRENSYDCVFCHPDVPKEFFGKLYTSENTKKFAATAKGVSEIDQNDLIRSGLEGTSFSDGSENTKLVSGVESVRRVICLAKEGGSIFAGHIHKHSESTILRRSFRFIGAPYQTTSEEIGTKSGFYVVSKDGISFIETSAPEHVKVRFSDVKMIGVENYDFSAIRGNIVQFDGDAVISVELEAMLKKRVLENEPFEISETDYSNLVVEPSSVENGEEYERVFSTSPRDCVELYVKNMPDDEFTAENVDRKRILSTFEALYDLIERRAGVFTSDGGANVRYKTLSARNFLSYETLEFDFERYRGLTLIYGKNLDNVGATNACGKSNIIKAIVYALFGRFPKKVKKENMSPWEDPTKDVCVTMTLESNGVNYRIESGLIKKGRETFHRVFNEDSGAELTKKQLAETRKFIEAEILHCGFDMFMKTTVLTSSEIFNFYCMKKEDKDDYLNTIFGTKTLNEVREHIKSYLKDTRSSYLEISRLIESKEHDIELNRSASERFEASRSDSVRKLNEEISRLEVEISELSSSKEPEKSDETIRLEAERSEVEKRIKGLNAKLQETSSASMKAAAAVEKDSATVRIMTNELSKHKDVVPRLCDSCKKVVAEGYNLTKYAKTIKSARESLKGNKDTLSEAKAAHARFEAERDAALAEFMTLERKIAESKTNVGRTSTLESEIRSRKATIDYISRQANPNARIIGSLEADMKELQKKSDEMLSKIRHLDFIQTKVVSQDVITNLLTSGFIRQLNERIRYYLQRLGLNLGVEFDNDFHYEFVRGEGVHPEFNSLSGGECLRIVIATSFAFKDFLESRRNITANIRFLDEFFEKDTDNLGMNSTISILKDFSRMTNQNVFLISNKLNEIDGRAFDNILVVNIKDSKSFIVEE